MEINSQWALVQVGLTMTEVPHRNCTRIVQLLCWILYNHQTHLYQCGLWYRWGWWWHLCLVIWWWTWRDHRIFDNRGLSFFIRCKLLRPIELFMQLRRHQIIYCLPNDVDHLLCLVIHTWRATSCDQIYCLIELSLLRLWSLLLRIVLREIHILLAQSDFGFYWRANYLSIFNGNV